MVVFSGAKHGDIAHVPFPPSSVVPYDPKIADANSDTLYSAISNVDVEIGAGNLVLDVRFFGGRYGIVSEKTSPAWQFTVLDSSFEGQRAVAICDHEAGLALVNVANRKNLFLLTHHALYSVDLSAQGS